MPPKLYFELTHASAYAQNPLATLTLGFATTAYERDESTDLAAEAAITSRISPLIIYSNGLEYSPVHE